MRVLICLHVYSIYCHAKFGHNYRAVGAGAAGAAAAGPMFGAQKKKKLHFK